MTRTLALLTALLLAVPAAAQPPQGGVERTAAGIRIDFQQTDLRLVVPALAEAAGLAIVYGDLPQRSVTLRTPTPVPPAAVRTYLENLLRSNNLRLVEEDGLLRVEATAAPAAAPVSYAGPGLGQGGEARIFVLPLRHAPAEDMARTIGALFGIGDGGGAAPELRSLAEELRAQTGDPLGAVAAPAAPPQRRRTGALSGEVQVIPDPRTNSLVIRGTPGDHETIRQAVAQLDTRPLQVLIEVLIAEVRRNGQFALGVSLDAPNQRVNGDGPVVGGELVGGSAGDVAVRILEIGRVRADVVLRLLAQNGTVSILSRPVILAQNNEQARILVGDQRPFIQVSRSLPTDGAVRDQVVQYRDVGTQLTIRPTINPDGYVTLQILQEVNSATGETQFGAPVVSTREAETRLLVKDGNTVVIGGLIDHQRTATNSGVPLLKDIPLLGWLFRSSRVENVTTETFLFLVPHVLYTDDEAAAATDLVRARTRHLDEALPDSIPLYWTPRDTASVTAGSPAFPPSPSPAPAPLSPPEPGAPPRTPRPR